MRESDFLDKKNIRKLGKVVRGDEDWDRYKRFIRHIPGHKNHIHVRIGNGPGQPGCFPGANPEDETEEVEGGGEDGFDIEALGLPPGKSNRKPVSVSSQGADIQE